MSEQLNYIQYLEQPELISRADKDLFHGWVSMYPYVPVFRVLLAARYQSEDHPDTAKYIEQAAFYVQDRKQLKQLLRTWQQIQVSTASNEKIHPSPSPEEEIIPEETITEEEARKEIPEAEPDIIENHKTEGEEVLTENEKQELQQIIHTGTTDTKDTSAEDAITIEPLDEYNIDKTYEDEDFIEDGREIDLTQSDKEETSVSADDQPVESVQTVDTEIQKMSSEEPSSTENEENSVEIVTEESISEEDDIAFLKSIDKYEEPPISATTAEEWQLDAPQPFIPEISENAVIDTGLVSADISWLTPWLEEFEAPEISIKTIHSVQTPPLDLIAQKEEISVPAAAQEEIKEAINPVGSSQEEAPKENPASGSHSFDEWLSILEQKKQHPEEAPVFDLPTPEVFKDIEISDEQAENELKPLVPETQGEGSVKRQAADSVSFKKDMATETLAKLYIRQGKIDLAISIYQQLIDKFPEKSSYFAGQINRLK